MINFQEYNKLDNAGLSFTTLLNAIPLFLTVTDSRGKIILWNRTAAALTGRAADSVRSKLLDDIVPEFSPLTSGAKNISAGAESQSLMDISLRNGIWLQCSVSLLKPPQDAGDPMLLISGEDISRRKEIEEGKLRIQRLEAAGLLATSFAHDFNNLINGISGALAMIECEREDAPDKHNENYTTYLDTISGSILKAGEMMKQLKTFSPGNGAKETAVDLCAVLKRAGKNCRQSFSESVEVEIDLEPSEAPVSGDPVELEQMVLNLCRNSYLAMTTFRGADEYSGGTLKIRLRYRTAEVEYPVWEIAVSDTGVGIPDYAREHIFDPVFSGGNDEDKRIMNLSLVYTIASRHRGTLEVESFPGEGTEVRILFPVPTGTDFKLQSWNKLTASGTTVLICDDEDLMRQITGQMLERRGYSVVYAASGEEALNRYREFSGSIRLVILDLNLYEESGLEVFRRLKALNPDLKVVISSGYSEHDHIAEAEKEGAAGFLQKPFTMDKLLRIVEVSLGSASGSPFSPLQEVP